MPKRGNGISIYGTAQYKRYKIVHRFKDKRRRWIYHRTGPKAGKRWYKPPRTHRKYYTVEKTMRYDIDGTTQQKVNQAAHWLLKKGRIPRKPFQTIDADKLLSDPEYAKKNTRKGEWIDKKVESWNEE